MQDLNKRVEQTVKLLEIASAAMGITGMCAVSKLKESAVEMARTIKELAEREAELAEALKYYAKHAHCVNGLKDNQYATIILKTLGINTNSGA